MFRKKKNGGAHPLPETRFPDGISFEYVRQILGRSDDFNSKLIFLGGDERIKAYLCYIDGIVSGESIARDVLRPATDPERFRDIGTTSEAAEWIFHGTVFNANVQKRDKADELIDDILSGFCALIFDDLGIALTFETKTDDKRSVEQPAMEKSVKGSKDSFNETYRVNTSLLRRKLRDPALRIEEQKVGRRSLSRVGIIYVDGLTDPEFVAELRRRVENIDVDAVLSSGNIEEYVLRQRKTLFPQMIMTERPDKFAIGIMEGRAGLLVDGLPLGFLMPANFSDFFRVPEDNSMHYIVASMLTVLRYIALLISVFLPAAYIAVTMYQPQMMPTKLMLSIIESRQTVPFSTAAEVLGMLIVFELLQEAGLRLPQTVGDTVSIIGGLVVGQSAVEAKVISPVVVIIVAMAGITGFTVPNHDMASALRVCRIAAVLLALVSGLYGMLFGSALLMYHLCTLESFGVAYMQPFAGEGDAHPWQAVIKPPLKARKRRKEFLRPMDERNQK
ncbi:MAG: spore germination protein [Clostridiales bacterium]|nr:spore germination protein [Clostridiales bacterium]